MQQINEERRNSLLDTCSLHYYNVPFDTALPLKQNLANKQIPVLQHPPYLPDLATGKFLLFLKLKTFLIGSYFESHEENNFQ
jgi:hypothetical protein